MTKELAPKQATALAVSEELQTRIAEVKENLESIETFVLPKIKMTSSGMQLTDGEEAVDHLEGTIIHTRRHNVYYDKPFNKKKPDAPACFSVDGIVPDPSIPLPQNPTCQGCPQAQFGTNSMKSGKACRNLKLLYVLLSDQSIMPRQLAVTPTSLKAANGYLMDLTERGVPYRKTRTKITTYKSDEEDTFVKLKFSKGAALTPEQSANVEFLRSQWLPVMNHQKDIDVESERF